tara:strand:- start:566 stop:874 length:309 start_codon:yes stop_codon:yes gene_type:complete
MNNLPNDIIINIIINKYEMEKQEHLKIIKELRLKHKIIMKEKYELEQDLSNCLFYIDSHGVNYCEECNEYGDDDEIIFCPIFRLNLCESCKDHKDAHAIQED